MSMKQVKLGAVYYQMLLELSKHAKKKPENFLEAISNRIRFSSNLNCARGDNKHAKEVKNSIFYDMGGPSLAAIIADVEAATKI